MPRKRDPNKGPIRPYLRRPSLASPGCRPVAVADFDEFFIARHYYNNRLYARAREAHARGEPVVWLSPMLLRKWRQGAFCPWRVGGKGLTSVDPPPQKA